MANKEQWNKLVMVAKTVSDNDIQDVVKFISSWGGMGGAGGQQAPSFSFK